MLTLIMLSGIADQQQWKFQNAKQEYRRTAKVPAGYDQADLDRGFLTKGLFSISRHPNFTAEQSVWLTLYLWSCYESGTLFNWTVVGVLGYLAIFQGSTWLTELISTGKYPEYKQYQAQVGRFLPKVGSGPLHFSNVKNAKMGGVEGKDDSVARKRYDLR